MEKRLEKVYNPRQFEDRIYRYWMDKEYFTPKRDPNKKPYTVVIPPPNITGQLHMGHALDETLQDILIRFRRMQGYAALWVPGTDHASIATEAKVVASIMEEGKTKEELGREAFLERAWDWKNKYGNRIVEQLKKLGSSCDWTRECFTLDEERSEAVKEVFVRLYQKGLIYRGERMVNWCPHCQTSISDAEVEYQEQEGNFYHLQYPLKDGSGFLVLATTRPETLLGDTAVAVHPDDERYQKFVGKTLFLPLLNREIPIVADEYVDREFGTGVVKITPAHDPNDYEVSKRHKLPLITVITDDGHMTDSCGKYAGMDRYEARKEIVKDLEADGFLIKTQPHNHNVGTCYRCGETVEPKLSTQWFVAMEELAKPAIEVVKRGDTSFVPKRFEKIYFHWMENIKDWCISRQLWWGHRIPAYYCASCGETVVAKEMPNVCPHCGSTAFTQDPDTLDTWFSSALWPFSVLGWPKETEDFQYFYPTSTLVTGYDIIFFWVARMIFSAVAYTGKAPFEHVFIHGLVRDAQGRKMSKSLGNGIDPLGVIQEYGADALRFTLANGTNAGNDMRYSEEKVRAARNFANKIWNASRFILMHIENEVIEGIPTELRVEDKWILSKLNRLVFEVTENLEHFEISVALQKVYEFAWNILCDWYIELCKPRLQAEGEDARNAKLVLCHAITTTLQLLHPFMPFITEEIWQALVHDGESIMISKWPSYREEMNFKRESADFEKVIEAIRVIRNLRAERNVAASQKTKIYIQTEDISLFEQSESFFQRLASAQELIVSEDIQIDNAVQAATDAARIFIPLADLIDVDKELTRLSKEEKECETEIALIDKKLSNQDFVSKAPQKVVQGQREKREKALQRLEKIRQSIASMEK
mgnify:CR=1 FL=1